MTLDEFRELTKDLPGVVEIITAGDEEGNSYHYVGGYNDSYFVGDDVDGEVNLIDLETFEGDSIESLRPAFVLWP